MAQRFGPWDDAINREMLAKIKAVSGEYSDGVHSAEDAMLIIMETLNEYEGTDLEPPT